MFKREFKRSKLYKKCKVDGCILSKEPIKDPADKRSILKPINGIFDKGKTDEYKFRALPCKHCGVFTLNSTN